MNEAENAAGGIYLFDDETAVQGFLSGPIVAAMGADPAIHDVNVRMFEVMEAHTAVTRGPVLEGSLV